MISEEIWGRLQYGVGVGGLMESKHSPESDSLGNRSYPRKLASSKKRLQRLWGLCRDLSVSGSAESLRLCLPTSLFLLLLGRALEQKLHHHLLCQAQDQTEQTRKARLPEAG